MMQSSLMPDEPEVGQRRHKRKRKRPYSVQMKGYSGWYQYARYETREQAEEALINFTRKYAPYKFEFRLDPENPEDTP